MLIFTRTKHGANRLTQQIEGAGINAAAIHGNKSQAARVKALEMFKRGQVTALVATEVAARGLDIKELPQVVNYELPNVPEDYVHRIGRTGRAGALGQAVSLVSSDENGLLRDIERVLKRAIPVLPTPAFEAAPDAHPVSERSAGAHPGSQGSHGGSRRSHSGQAPARSSAPHGGNSAAAAIGATPGSIGTPTRARPEVSGSVLTERRPPAFQPAASLSSKACGRVP